ncbi:MAG: aldo/keto reductase [Rubripirellula sp.]|jgi:aryl-alcohol dehydrogenase-like predicted oxidoreductase
MQTRLLGSTDLNLSVVGLGTWAIGGGDWAFGWGDQDDDQAIAAIKRAVDVGVNWIDTAAVYGFGKSETLVGKAVAELPAGDRPLIATKCGRTNAGNGQIGKSLQRASVIAECEASLKRLRVDCIDLYQMHWPQPDEEIEEGWETLVDLKKQGKVRHIGVSNHDVSQLQRLQRIHPVASQQPPYSMISDDAEAEIMPFCAENNIGVVCYSPMGKGLLTGSFNRERARDLSDKDHRSRDPRFQSPQLEINLEFVNGLNEIATKLDWSVAELAIAWVLRRPEVTSAIVGARRPNQIEQTAVAGTRVMPEDAMSEVNQLLKKRGEALASLEGVEQARV